MAQNYQGTREVACLVLVEKRKIMLPVRLARDPRLDDLILEAAFKVGLRLDVLLIPVVFTHEEYYSPLAKKTLFYENTQREAILF